jgi:hypothetical protein
VRTFGRAPDGRLVVTVYEGHITLFAMLLGEVRALVASDETNRTTARLFPRAYLDPTEDVAEAEWQSMVHDDLVRDKLAAFDDVRSALTRGRPGPSGSIVVELDAEQEEHLLGSLNDIRLVLAEVIDGSESDAGTADDDNVLTTTDLLEWLTDLVSELIELKLGDHRTE